MHLDRKEEGKIFMARFDGARPLISLMEGARTKEEKNKRRARLHIVNYIFDDNGEWTLFRDEETNELYEEYRKGW